MKSSTIKIDGVGPVLFERSAKAKHLNITVKPFQDVRVAVPKGVSRKEAEEVARAKVPWIQKHQTKMKRLEREYNTLSEHAVQIDRKKARALLVARLDELAKKHGFTYNRVFIRNQKTRWGSCSAKNNISLNVKLLLLPEDLRDFIIFHELVHTRVKSHNNDFWTELLKVEPKARVLAKRVNRHSVRLM